MQLGLLGLIAERGGFADIAGIAEAFEYWSISKRGGQFGYIATPVDPAGKRDRIPTADFTSIAAHHFTEAARDWLTGTRGFTAKLVPEYAPHSEERRVGKECDRTCRLGWWQSH